MKEFIEAFRALRHTPRMLWFVFAVYTFDGAAAFGILPLMKAFLGQDIGIRPELASMWVSTFLGLLSLAMVVGGKVAEERFGIRQSIVLALALAFSGRFAYTSAPFAGGVGLVAIGLVAAAIGEGVLLPVCYAGVKKYTTENTRSMGFALLYAAHNLGAMLIGPVSAHVRTSFDVAYTARQSRLSGFNAVNIVCTAITGLIVLVFLLATTKEAPAKVRREPTPSEGRRQHASSHASPFKNAHFLVFVFAFMPVRTLWAHVWLTMPEYVLRCYPPGVADRMEWLVDSMNPLIILFGVPLLTALTRRADVFTMLIVGSFVCASAPLLLVPGPNTAMLVGYFVVFSVGEALFSPRFIQYAAEIAPEGRAAEYTGVAMISWFVASVTTGIYSGYLLEAFVPKDGPKSSGTIWLLYAAIAMTGPALLFLTRRWIRSGITAPTPEIA